VEGGQKCLGAVLRAPAANGVGGGKKGQQGDRKGVYRLNIMETPAALAEANCLSEPLRPWQRVQAHFCSEETSMLHKEQLKKLKGLTPPHTRLPAVPSLPS
jgi:hypothetical protein